MDMEIWNVWATNRIPGAIGGLTTIIAIWVAARFSSVASEQSEENKTVLGKVLLTLFGGSVILWGIQINLIGNWRVMQVNDQRYQTLCVHSFSIPYFY